VASVYSGAIKDTIHAYKFGGKRAAAVDLANSLQVLLPRVPKDTLIVPIPTATKRMRERGFDHASLLAKNYATQLGKEYASLLVRTDQHRQLGHNKNERTTAARGSMRLKSGVHLQGVTVLLVDDVVTTGSTLTEAARVLREAGAAHIDAIVVAQTVL
jgi:ComF family protein